MIDSALSISNIEVAFFSSNSKLSKEINLFYQSFGPKIGHAPVIVLIHALTGNSNISGPTGWWSNIVGPEKSIDTTKYTVIAFNIPGNNYPTNNELDIAYQDYSIREIAHLFWEGLKTLQVKKIHSIIGLSLGGYIAWEMTLTAPNQVEQLISVAATHLNNPWLMAHAFLQEQLILNSQEGLKLARMQSMLMFRTAKGFKEKFAPPSSNKVENWLQHHGNSLANRFSTTSYLIMNQLLKSGGSSNLWKQEQLLNTSFKIHRIIIPGDLLFTKEAFEAETQKLESLKLNFQDHFIESIHGHDAFLIEHDQIQHIFKQIFHEQF